MRAPFDLTVRLLPLLRAAASAEDPARVINIGSIDGLGTAALPHFAYSSSKAGVHMLTQSLARQLAPQSITVNALAPGPVREQDDGLRAWTTRKRRAEIEARVPLGRDRRTPTTWPGPPSTWPRGPGAT